MIDPFWLFWFLVWGAIGVCVAFDSRKRGGSTGDQIGMFFGVLLVNIIALVLWFIFRPKSHDAHKSVNDSPIQALKLRYAKGEITKRQFEEMKKELS